MFYGTKFLYNFIYFVTSMSPAYFLFLLQINFKFKQLFDKKLFGTNFTVYVWCIILFVALLLLAIFLKWLLKVQFINGIGTAVLSNQVFNFSNSNIEENNGNVISFLLGNIVPAVLIMENSIKEAIIVFILLQVIIFILVNKSSDVFPNIMLIIIGIDICKTKHGKYLFKLKGNDEEPTNIYQLGDPAKSKLYITACKK